MVELSRQVIHNAFSLKKSKTGANRDSVLPHSSEHFLQCAITKGAVSKVSELKDTCYSISFTGREFKQL